MFNINPSKSSLLDTSENNVISDMDLDKIALHLITQQRFRENIIIPRTVGPVRIKTNEEKLIESTMESCIFKSIASCVIGMFVLYNIKNYVYFYVSIIKKKLDL